MYGHLRLIFILLTTLMLVSACGDSNSETNETEGLTAEDLMTPSLDDPQVMMRFIEDSQDLLWQAFNYPINMESNADFNFEYGHTQTDDSLTPVQWNLSWKSGVSGVGFPAPYITYRIGDLTPGNTYYPRVMTQVESNTSIESFEPGVAPQFRLGAFSSEPTRVEEDGTGMIVLHVDDRAINNITDTVQIGFVDVPEQVLEGEFYLYKRAVNKENSVSVTANENGEVWLLISLHSEHEGSNFVHLTHLAIDW